MPRFLSDFAKLVKLRLSFLVVFSASISFLIGSKEQGFVNWTNWFLLTIGGFLVTAAANGFNEIIEKDLDKLMKRTSDRPIPAGRMTTGQALVLSIFMSIIGTLVLVKLNSLTGVLSVFSIFFYAFIYTPMKRKSPFAVFLGAIPGALPPLIGYFAAFAHPAISWTPIILFLVQFVWQFPHFWSIAWVLDEDYKKAGFRLLPTTKPDKISALIILLTTIVLIPVSLMPTLYHIGGTGIALISIVADLYFLYTAIQLFRQLDIASARRMMYVSFVYLPLVQVGLLLDFIS
jgi:protoheme IX farnesyltransferase